MSIKNFTRAVDYVSIGEKMTDEEKTEVFLYLCEFAANSKITDAEGQVRWLVQNGVNVDTRTYRDQTALMLAVVESDDNSTNKMVKLLIELGADVNAEEDDYNDVKYTPLYFAAQNSNAEAVRILLEAGANPNLPSNETPFWIAIMKKHSLDANILCVVELLLQYGADPEDNFCYIYTCACDGNEHRLEELYKFCQLVIKYTLDKNKLKEYEEYLLDLNERMSEIGEDGVAVPVGVKNENINMRDKILELVKLRQIVLRDVDVE